MPSHRGDNYVWDEKREKFSRVGLVTNGTC